MIFSVRMAAIAAALLLGAGARAAPAQPVSVVLVHGALVDGSSWRGVYDALTRNGYAVTVVQEPLTSFDADLAATRRAIDQQPGPIVLVGHSYGGQIITVAGTDPKVKALVYVASLVHDAGEISAEVYQPSPEIREHIRMTPDGFAYVDPRYFAADVGADLPPSQANFMAHSQMLVNGAVMAVRVPVAAWRSKPSYAIVATDDRELDPKLAQSMARRSNSKVTLLKGSHLVHVAQPEAVAQVIEAAASAIR
jgi:pimeloyl-ACP methyl ester carboxylesterase